MTAIHTEKLTKRYGATLALDALDLAVEAGEVYGYLGPNGAGKTTTIRLLLGLHRRPRGGPSSSASMRGATRSPLTAASPTSPVSPSSGPRSPARTLEFLARVRGGTDADYRDVLVERFQLDPAKKVRALSKGNRQKVQLIAAFASRANLLILDEPTSGLDPLRRQLPTGRAALPRSRRSRLPARPQGRRRRGVWLVAVTSLGDGGWAARGTGLAARRLTFPPGRPRSAEPSRQRPLP